MPDPYGAHPLKPYGRPVRSRTTRFLANGKTLLRHHIACAPREHRFDISERKQRREDNKIMKLIRLKTRGRNVHGRKGISAKKVFIRAR
jgi:hypothetical protein